MKTTFATTLIKGNVVEEIRILKQQPGGDIRLTGSSTLAQTLMQADLKLVESKVFRSGAVLLRYQPDGDGQ